MFGDVTTCRLHLGIERRSDRLPGSFVACW
jgi:hypothetical protein